MVRVPLPLSVNLHELPAVPLVTVTDVPSAQWMVDVPSRLSATEQEVPASPGAPAGPRLPEQAAPAISAPIAVRANASGLMDCSPSFRPALRDMGTPPLCNSSPPRSEHPP